MKNVASNLGPSRPFLIFKESSAKRNLRRSVCSFGQILTVSLIHIE